MVEAEKVVIQEVAWHRNGISGEGFYAIRFLFDVDAVSDSEAKTWNIPAGPALKAAQFLAILFDEPGQCAVICLDAISEHGVAFGKNSWRGDLFEDALREAIRTMPSSGSVRVGPFGLPVA